MKLDQEACVCLLIRRHSGNDGGDFQKLLIDSLRQGVFELGPQDTTFVKSITTIIELLKLS